jgi:dTDP-4-amino-4,6-dideoxygalactose transaminase
MDPIPYSRQEISELDIAAVGRVLQSSFLTQGPEVELFEHALKDKFQVNFAVCCSSGTAALHLAYAAIGINEQSIGFVPAVTFSATANAFRYLGAQVIFCDIDPETGIIDLNSLEEQLVKFRKKSDAICAISPVSFAGKVAPLEECRKLADAFGCSLVEDASHSAGAYNCESHDLLGKSITSKSLDAACMSFHPVKHICAGEGGAVLTNQEDIARKANLLRAHGIVRPHGDDHPTPWLYEQSELGWNYRLSDLHSALGRSQLSRLDESIAKRKKLAFNYTSIFSQEPFRNTFSIPEFEIGHAWHLYIIRFFAKGMRNLAYKFLKSRGVMSQIHYIPLYKHPYYQNITGGLTLPGTEKYFDSCLSIPIFPSMNDDQQNYIIECMKAFIHSET